MWCASGEVFAYKLKNGNIMTRETRILNKIIRQNDGYELLECFPVFHHHTHAIRKNGVILSKHGRFTRKQALMWFNRYLKHGTLDRK